MHPEKLLPTRILFYIAGLLLMTAGIALSVKSGLGVSPISSVPYTMTCVFGIEMGLATILFHIFLVLLQILLLRRRFEWKNLLQIPVGILFGVFTTFSNFLMTFLPAAENIWLRLSLMLASTLLIAAGLFFYVPANIVPLAGEGAMLAISGVTQKPFPTVKMIFDSSMVLFSLLVCLIFLRSLGSVGIGTTGAAILVGSELALLHRIFRPLPTSMPSETAARQNG